MCSQINKQSIKIRKKNVNEVTLKKIYFFNALYFMKCLWIYCSCSLCTCLGYSMATFSCTTSLRIPKESSYLQMSLYIQHAWTKDRVLNLLFIFMCYPCTNFISMGLSGKSRKAKSCNFNRSFSRITVLTGDLFPVSTTKFCMVLLI